MAGNGLLGRAGCAARLVQRRVFGIDQQGEVAGLQVQAAVRPRNGGVDLADQHARLAYGGRQVFMDQAQAVAALCIGWRDLEQHHVGRQQTLVDQAGQVGVVAGQDVQHSGLRQRAVGAAGRVAEEVDGVGMRRLQRV